MLDEGGRYLQPAGAIVIIDEPEIHLHRAVQGVLLDKIEEARPNCTFIYITHDLDFAATHHGRATMWLKELNSTNGLGGTPGTGMPDALLFQVLGSRRPLLFVEGDETSYDSAIYTAGSPKEMAVPRQSCEKVVEAAGVDERPVRVRNLSVRGLVDRDRRGDEEVDALRADGVLVADVAEVENLLCLPEALKVITSS